MRAILFCILISLQFSVFGQSYVPLLDNVNEWHLGYCDNNGCYKDMYYTDGDTIAYGHSYKILDGYHYISRLFWLREDVSEKKVYTRITFQGNSNEYLLYDFGLEEGDSMRMLNPISPFPPDLGYFKLDSIRTKPILGSQTGKYFYFSPTPTNEDGWGILPVWVEGVGSLSLINAPGGDPNYYGAGQLTCFWKNYELYFHDEQMGLDCESILKNDEVFQSQVNFVVNRQKKGFLFHSDKVRNIRIYDLSGRLQRTFENKGQSHFEIDLNGLQNGIYRLQYFENGRWQTISFVLK